MKAPTPPTISFSPSVPENGDITSKPTPKLPRLRAGLTILALLAMGSAGLNAQNLVFNGGFESPAVPPDSFIIVQSGEPTLTAWEVTQTSVDVVHGIYLGAAAAGGFQFLDLDGSPGPGGVAQNLATTPGITYELTFQFANNFLSAQSTSYARVHLYDPLGDVLAPVTISHGTSRVGNLDWTLYSATFTANQAVTTLNFTSLNPATAGGILLDQVSVVAVPEPSSLAFIAAASWGLFFRRRV